MNMGSEFKMVDRGLKELLRAFESIAHGDSYVKAGIIGPKAAERPEDGSITMGELAIVQEFGTTDGHIPARPFIASAFEAHRPEYADLLKKLMARVYENKLSLPQALRTLGLKMEADIRNTVTRREVWFPPNAESTIERKGSDVPLVDTAILIRAVTSQVVLKGTGVDGERVAGVEE